MPERCIWPDCKEPTWSGTDYCWPHYNELCIKALADKDAKNETMRLCYAACTRLNPDAPEKVAEALPALLEALQDAHTLYCGNGVLTVNLMDLKHRAMVAGKDLTDYMRARIEAAVLALQAEAGEEEGEQP